MILCGPAGKNVKKKKQNKISLFSRSRIANYSEDRIGPLRCDPAFSVNVLVRSRSPVVKRQQKYNNVNLLYAKKKKKTLIK